MAPVSVSVVIPTHNRAHLLERSVGSVLAQSYADFELIIVDDASSDGTAERVAAFNDPRIRYIRHDQNKGGAAARNTGIAAAKAPIVAFQDSDDEWLHHKLASQMADFAAAPEDVIAVSCAMRSDGDDVRARNVIAKGCVDISDEILLHNFVGTPTLAVKKSALDQAGGFDESLPRFHDWDLVVRLAAIGKFQLDDRALVTAHMTPGNITSSGPAGAKALQIMYGKYADRMRDNPAVYATFCYAMGRELCLYDSAAAGRAYLRKSLAVNPRSAKVWVAFVLSFLGSSGFSLVFRIRRELVGG